ncbi:hypothetical protein [Saccharibacillus sp. JS10]|uniref:hypothetical protein n=1 Tax=Saccharibacillus sp. JS10 TaxID=2950552 RepID=UPI00210A874A|nr:hypothetical protein [Saccharibacillus sp. JS10]MCQ4085863.1 hypothetical protein [Saccharibacillus sp. JS10]
MLPYNFKVNIDLISDWNSYLGNKLSEFNLLSENDIRRIPERDVAWSFFELSHKLIEPNIRRIHFSRDFNCDPTLQSGLDNLVKKIERGENLTPHLSRGIKRLNTPDDLLNDWGIYHLHLGITVESDGFVERGGPLLYAFFSDSDAYLIDIMDHYSFATKRLLTIIHENWPEVIQQYRINATMEPRIEYTDDQIKCLRKAGIVTFTQVEEGVAYAPPGGGQTSARTSGSARISANRFHNILVGLELYIKQNLYEFINKVKARLGKMPPELTFRLGVGVKGEFYAIETNSMISFLIRE